MIKEMKFLAQFFEESAKNYDSFFVFRLCNNLKYEKFKKGEVVFAQHEPSNNKLYVILSGKVMIQKKEDLDKIMAIRERKTLQEIPLETPFNSPSNKNLRLAETSLLPIKVASIDSFDRIPKEEEDESDGEINIDRSHYELYEKQYAEKHRRDAYLNINNNFNPRKTSSFQIIETSINNSLFNTATSPEFRRNLKVPYEEINSCQKWSMLLSRHFSKILKKPFKIQKSDIISPNLLETLLRKYGNIIRIMEKGEGVGEKALIENNPRSATVCTITPCEFLILEKKDLKHAKDEFEGVLKRRTDFLIESLKLNLQSFSSKVKENMLYSFSVEKHKKGHLITNQGSNDLRFYLIEDGEVIIEKIVSMEESIKGHKEFLNKKDQKMTLCISGRGNFLGEEILFNEANTYDYTSTVLSNEAIILAVNKHIFFAKFPSEIRQVLVMKFQMKVNNRNKQIAQILYRKNHNDNNSLNTASDIFYSRGVNVFSLLQKSCYNSFNKNIKRTIKTEPSVEKPKSRSPSNKSPHCNEERAKFAKYFIGPRAKCKYIKNTISFPKNSKIFDLSNVNKPLKKSNSRTKHPVKLIPLDSSLNPYEGLSNEKKVIRKGETNQPVIDVELLLSYSEGFLNKTQEGEKFIHKLDFGEEDEVRFKYFKPKELVYDYLQETHKNFNSVENVKKMISFYDNGNKAEGEGVFVNYSKMGPQIMENDKNMTKMKLELEDLSHMNSTYNFSNLKKNVNISNPSNKFQTFHKEFEKVGKNRELLQTTLKCLKIEKNNEIKKINENFDMRLHENILNMATSKDFSLKKMHDIRLVQKCREKKQRGKRGVLV